MRVASSGPADSAVGTAWVGVTAAGRSCVCGRDRWEGVPELDGWASRTGAGRCCEGNTVCVF